MGTLFGFTSVTSFPASSYSRMSQRNVARTSAVMEVYENSTPDLAVVTDFTLTRITAVASHALKFWNTVGWCWPDRGDHDE